MADEITNKLDEAERQIHLDHEDSVKDAKAVIAQAELKKKAELDLIEKLREQFSDSPRTSSEQEKPKAKLFQLKNAIRQLVSEKSFSANVTMPGIYDEIVSRYPELQKRDRNNLRGQISQTLSGLTKDGVLVLHEKPLSTFEPNVYRQRSPGA